MSSKPPADLVAEMDQRGAIMQAIASMQAEYFRKLMDEGFYREEALALVQQHFEEMLMRDDPSEDDG